MTKIISRNVNGIRAILKKGFLEFLENENPDILGMQEIKGQKEQLEPENLENFRKLGYKTFWNSAQRKGYSGTAIFTKKDPISEIKGMCFDGIDKNICDDVILEDAEGRVLTLEFEEFYFTTVYTPNSKADLSRLDYRKNSWDKNFLSFLKNLEKKKPVIFCGDLNVAHEEIDLARPKQNIGTHGFTNEEREGFTNFVNAGFVDTFRYKNPEKTDSYSWWSYFGKARENNIGWRIDYVLCSEILKDKIKETFIKPEILGSDHCPVGIILGK